MTKKSRKCFKYDISDDCPELHPQKICDVCRRKLNRAVTDNRQIVSQSIASFKEHDSDCNVCFKKMKKRLFSIKFESDLYDTPLSMHDVELYAIKVGFIVTTDDNDSKVFSKLKYVEGKTIVVELSVHVDNNLSWNLFAFEHEVPVNGDITSDFQSHLNQCNYKHFFDILSSIKVCPGNNDFPDLISHQISKGVDLCFYTHEKKSKSTNRE